VPSARALSNQQNLSQQLLISEFLEGEIRMKIEFDGADLKRRGNKFAARKVIVDGHEFASAAEARRYGELKLLQRAGVIKALGVHPMYPLTINGVTVGKFTADFAYFEASRKIVEDVKGLVTEAASLRMRVFMALYPEHELKIVTKGQVKPMKQRKVAA